MECLNGFSQKWFIIRTLTGINYWLPKRMGYPHELNEQKFDRTIEIGEHWWIINGARCPVRWVNGEKDWWWELPRIEWIHCLKDCYERVFSFYALLIYSQRTKRWKKYLVWCTIWYLSIHEWKLSVIQKGMEYRFYIVKNQQGAKEMRDTWKSTPPWPSLFALEMFMFWRFVNRYQM